MFHYMLHRHDASPNFQRRDELSQRIPLVISGAPVSGTQTLHLQRRQGLCKVTIAQHIPERTNLFKVSHTFSIGHRVAFFLISLVPMSLLSSS